MNQLPHQQTRLHAPDAALVSLLESLLAEVPEEIDEPAVATCVDDTVESAVEQVAEPALLNDLASQPITDSTPTIPAWARHDFRVLLFRVGDTRFAIPLVLLRAVILMPDRVTQVPGAPRWLYGVAHHRGESVRIAELGSLVGEVARCDAPRYLLLIGDGRSALLCDRVDEAASVAASQVRWRPAEHPRVWLAGLLVERLCVLLDADTLYDAMRHG